LSKRLISFLLCVSLILAMFPSGVVAAEGDITISVDNVTGNVGNTVVVPVRMTDIPDDFKNDDRYFAGVQVDISFDTSKLEFIEATDGSLPVAYASLAGMVIPTFAKFAYTNPEIANANGTVGAIYNSGAPASENVRTIIIDPE